MDIQIALEDLQREKLFIATPMYGGMAHGLFIKSCLDLQGCMAQYGIETKFSFLFNESLITRARNYLVDEFLRSTGFTRLLFIDSDIHFDPNDILALIALDKDVIGGPYPKKSINWTNVAKAMIQNPAANPGELEKVAGEYVFNPIPGTKQFNVTEPLEVLEIGTGFMMIKRDVFTVWKEAYPEYEYKPDHKGQQHFDGERYIHAYFDTVIDTPPDNVAAIAKKIGKTREEVVALFPEELREKLVYVHSGSDRYLSEDYMFCQWWRKLGGQIWICPWMKTQHIGTYPFTGDMQAIANLTGQL